MSAPRRPRTAGSSPGSSRASKSRHSGSVLDAVAFSSQSTAPTSASGSPRLDGAPLHPPPYREKPDREAEDLPPSAGCCSRLTVETAVSGSSSDEDLDRRLPDGAWAVSGSDLTDDGDDDDDDGHGMYDAGIHGDGIHGDGSSPADAHRRHLRRLRHDGVFRIPPLGEYHHDVVDSSVRPSTPHEFAQLFPGLHRMSVRHDEFTTDGNMNLRVDVAVPVGSRRRLTSFQLFHLRMYDLTKREFSLRRYGRDSGREVCSSKLTFVDPAAKKRRRMLQHGLAAGLDAGRDAGLGTDSHSGAFASAAAARPATAALQRSVSMALRSLGAMAASTRPSLRRALSSSARPATAHGLPSSAYGAHDSERGSLSSRSHSTPSFFPGRAPTASRLPPPPPPPKPTNTIKLEFSNYARVDVVRRGGNGSRPTGSSGTGTGSGSVGGGIGGSSAFGSVTSFGSATFGGGSGGGSSVHLPGHHDNVRYEFAWWGHKYAWKRTVEKHLQVASYHLLRDDSGEHSIAHIVPETRAPNQVEADELAGGWLPPCHMWISDPSVLECLTDVADVIVATGLIALVDDGIRTRWPQPCSRPHGLAAALPRLAARTRDMEHAVGSAPRALMQHVFHRRNSHGSQSSHSGGHSGGCSGSGRPHAVTFASSPLRHAEPTY